MKALHFGNKVIPTSKIDAVEISMSQLTKNYQVLLRQGSNSISIFSSNDHASAKAVFDSFVASLYETIDVSCEVSKSLDVKPKTTSKKVVKTKSLDREAK